MNRGSRFRNTKCRWKNTLWIVLTVLCIVALCVCIPQFVFGNSPTVDPYTGDLSSQEVVSSAISSENMEEPSEDPSVIPPESSSVDSSAISFPASSSISSQTEVSEDPSSSDPEETEDIQIVSLFSAYEEPAIETLHSMTLEEKVGQVFVFLSPTSEIPSFISKYQPGGLCLNAAHFADKSPDQVKSMIASMQAASKYGLLICCDEEGGTVTRVSRFPELRSDKFQSPREIYISGGMDAVRRDTAEKAQLLKELGINTNLAPVADLSDDLSEFIYERSFGSDAQLVSQFIQESVQIYQQNGMACVLKHFPGYGGNADTHVGLARDDRSYAEYASADLLPFSAGIQQGVPIIMVNHNIVECIDSQRPATLSPQVNSVLRNTLGFTGLIMTDDMNMEAISQYTGETDPAVAAFLAGNELLLYSQAERSFQALYDAVVSGEVSEQRLNESVLRILEWKYFMGIL